MGPARYFVLETGESAVGTILGTPSDQDLENRSRTRVCWLGLWFSGLFFPQSGIAVRWLSVARRTYSCPRARDFVPPAESSSAARRQGCAHLLHLKWCNYRFYPFDPAFGSQKYYTSQTTYWAVEINGPYIGFTDLTPPCNPAKVASTCEADPLRELRSGGRFERLLLFRLDLKRCQRLRHTTRPPVDSVSGSAGVKPANRSPCYKRRGEDSAVAKVISAAGASELLCAEAVTAIVIRQL